MTLPILETPEIFEPCAEKIISKIIWGDSPLNPEYEPTGKKEIPSRILRESTKQTN